MGLRVTKTYMTITSMMHGGWHINLSYKDDVLAMPSKDSDAIARLVVPCVMKLDWEAKSKSCTVHDEDAEMVKQIVEYYYATRHIVNIVAEWQGDVLRIRSFMH